MQNTKYGTMTYDEMEKKIKKSLTEKRFHHTEGVIISAIELAKKYDIDKDKAKIAALLHDNARCLTGKEILKKCNEYGIILDEIFMKAPKTAHAILGAEVAKIEYGITDEEIISAIKWHTTGKPDMTVFDKLIYLADCIEPYRSMYEGLTLLREEVSKDLDSAMIMALRASICFTKRKGEKLHPLSQSALSFLYITNEKIRRK